MVNHIKILSLNLTLEEKYDILLLGRNGYRNGETVGMDNAEILIRVSRGEKIKGYKVLQVGIDAIGKYKKIQTPEGKVERVYIFEEKDLDKFFMDRYNSIHNYRRKDDRIMLYYNVETGDFSVVAVKVGDDLSKYPFNLPNSLVITKEMIEQPKLTFPKGLVPITYEFLGELTKNRIITDEIARVLYFNRKNPGFFL